VSIAIFDMEVRSSVNMSCRRGCVYYERMLAKKWWKTSEINSSRLFDTPYIRAQLSVVSHVHRVMISADYCTISIDVRTRRGIPSRPVAATVRTLSKNARYIYQMTEQLSQRFEMASGNHFALRSSAFFLNLIGTDVRTHLIEMYRTCAHTDTCKERITG
jgi:hypothetical protein